MLSILITGSRTSEEGSRLGLSFDFRASQRHSCCGVEGAYELVKQSESIALTRKIRHSLCPFRQEMDEHANTEPKSDTRGFCNGVRYISDRDLLARHRKVYMESSITWLGCGGTGFECWGCGRGGNAEGWSLVVGMNEWKDGRMKGGMEGWRNGEEC